MVSRGTFAALETTWRISFTVTLLFPWSRAYTPLSSITSIALSGSRLSLKKRTERSTAWARHSGEYFTLWNSSYFGRMPFRIFMLSSRPGSRISIFWNLLASALSFSKVFVYSSKVVEPMQRRLPFDNAGLRMFAASRLPLELLPDPAPIIVCISSMKRIAFGFF